MQCEEFGELLAHYLDREERSARWLARQLKVDPAAVAQWTNAKTKPRSLDRVKEIARLLRIRTLDERQVFFKTAGFAEFYQEETVAPPPQDTLGRLSAQVQVWWHNFLELDGMNAHMEESAMGRFLYIFGVLTHKLTARRWLTALLFSLLWWLTLRLVAPLFSWFSTGQGNYLTAALLYLLALFTIPFVIAATTRADYQERYEPTTYQAHAVLWWLKSTGALVGFNLLSLTLWLVLFMAHYAGLSELPALGLALMWLFPLGMAYVAAHRIPADRYYMGVEAAAVSGATPRDDKRRGLFVHEADITFFTASLLVGPFWLWFLWNFGDFLRDRTLGAVMVFAALIALAAWLAFKNKKAEGNSPRPDDPLQIEN